MIGVVKDKFGKENRLMKDKLKIFEEFFRKLYSAEEKSVENLEEYINKNWKVRLSEQDKGLMEEMISEEEIEEVINNLKGGKSPGLDGLGPEYYKAFKKCLIPKLKVLYNSILRGDKIPLSWKQSLIILILKPSKDPTDPGSYRPISLINQDAKILTAIMAKRLNTFIYKYIHKDQCGFIQGRQMANLIGKTINKINIMDRDKQKAGILALDIFKAFDCVEWPALKIILNKIGLGERFKGLINQLYSHNTSVVMVNDGITDQIQILRGTRQGCPLSPVLFAIVIETLANVIRNDENLEGIGTKEKNKISLFADDTLITIKDPVKKIDRIDKHLKEFGEKTGLEINWAKSEIMLFNYTKKEVQNFISNKRMLVKVKESIKYLGIDITKNLQGLQEKNCKKLKLEIKQKLEDYKNIKLSWFGRIAVVKMKILPKINFLFRMVPIKVSEEELKEWQKLINNFCNGYKRARINKKYWYKSQKEGGLGLPNLKWYYYANQLRYIIEGVSGRGDLEWLETEDTNIEMKLENIFFRNFSKKEIEKIENPFIKNIIEIWKKNKRKLLPNISILTPIVMMEKFPINLREIIEKEIKKQKIYRLKDWMKIMINKDRMKERLQETKISWLNYIQLEQWTKSMKRYVNDFKEYTKFEQIIIQRENMQENEILKGITSEIYKMLAKEQEEDYLRKMWEEETSQNIDIQEWRKIWKQRHLKKLSIRIKENYYKIVWKWYLTPVKLNQIDEKYSRLCWRGCQEIGTYMHMWWNCNRIMEFWQKVFKEIKEIIGVEIPICPNIGLLSIYNKIEGTQARKELITNLLIAARLIIAKKWKTNEKLQIEEWYKEVWKIVINDKLTCRIRFMRGLVKGNDFEEIWKIFLEKALIRDSKTTLSQEEWQFWKLD